MDETSINLIARWRGGDEQAAAVLFSRYAEQLTALAANRLSSRLVQRIDPEEVVQSAFRSFFLAARNGSCQLQRGGDLWRLLVSITLHKLHDQVKLNTAGKRSVHSEQRSISDHPDGQLACLPAEGPSPLEVVALTDELERILRGLSPLQRQIFELRLQGYHLDEIAEAIRRSVRTVSRVLEAIKEDLEQQEDAIRPCESTH